MNMFEQMKQEMLRERPSVQTLPFLKRVKALFTQERHELTKTIETEFGQFSQSAVLVEIDGKEYTKRFGRLN